VRESCVACHGATEAAASAQTASARAGFSERAMNVTAGARANDPQCVSCHAQHGEEKQLRASLRRMER
jgi:cytochrome c553